MLHVLAPAAVPLNAASIAWKVNAHFIVGEGKIDYRKWNILKTSLGIQISFDKMWQTFVYHFNWTRYTEWCNFSSLLILQWKQWHYPTLLIDHAGHIKPLKITKNNKNMKCITDRTVINYIHDLDLQSLSFLSPTNVGYLSLQTMCVACTRLWCPRVG